MDKLHSQNNTNRALVYRGKHGASLALVAVCAGILILSIVLIFRIVMYLGGVQELNSTADAAALNIAKRSMEIKTSPSVTQYGGVFSDCTDSQGQIGLSNINRIWGKAYLINANVEEMTANQQITNAASTAADRAYQAAQEINDDLYAKLKDSFTLGSFFDQIAGIRFHKMLGNPQVSSDTNNNWSTALIDRGDQSNLAANSNQIPGPAKSRFAGVAVGNNTYLPGYFPMQANNKNFYYISFHNGETTHLVTENYFQRNRGDKLGLADISNPLPNAFSGYGATANSMNSHSFAVANPQRQYNLSTPHAFVSISLVNLAYWIVQGRQVNVTTYGFTPATQFGANHIPLGASGNNYLDGYASLGNEFQGSNSLWTALTSIQQDPTDVLASVVQRMQEITPDFSLSNLQQLLQQQQLLPNASTYIIYPSYSNLDATNPSIKIAVVTQPPNKSLPKWLNTAAGNDGQQKTLATKEPVQDDPNYNWQMVYGPNFQSGQHWTEVGGNIDWTPSTGYSQTLGQLTIMHTTRAFFTANQVN